MPGLRTQPGWQRRGYLAAIFLSRRQFWLRDFRGRGVMVLSPVIFCFAGSVCL